MAPLPTGIDIAASPMAEKVVADEEEKETQREKVMGSEEKAGYVRDGADSEKPSLKVGDDSTKRQLRPRHIQLIGIGGTIGTALYVQIGHGLINGGPGSLFLAFTIWYVGPRILHLETLETDSSTIINQWRTSGSKANAIVC
jgi:yeast amino acid transporter